MCLVSHTAGRGSKRKVESLEDNKPSASSPKTVDGKKGTAGKEAAKRSKTEDIEPTSIDQKSRKGKDLKRTEEASASADKKGNNTSEKGVKTLASPLSDNSSSELDKKLEKQAKAIWDLKDNLKKNVSTSEMRSMLDANKMDVSGTELELRDRW